jgi:hypothetical protein
VSVESNVRLNTTLSEYPINVPFDNYSLFGTSCYWNLYPNLPPSPFDPFAVTINSNEELEQYIFCNPENGSYPDIDFTQHTLILAIGIVDFEISAYNTTNLQQLSKNDYKLNIEIHLSDSKYPNNGWTFAYVVDKLSDESIIEADINYEYYPTKIPFTEFYTYLSGSYPDCWEVLYPLYGNLTIINSEKELKKYFHCVDDYPIIDFSQHTLLLARSHIASAASKIYSINLLKRNRNLYTMEIFIHEGITGEKGCLCVAILTPKIDEGETVLLSIKY